MPLSVKCRTISLACPHSRPLGLRQNVTIPWVLMYNPMYITGYLSLEKVGFNVFRDCWDLSWSNADTLWDRVNGCHELMKQIQAMSDAEINATLEKTTSHINSNYYILSQGTFRIKSNENFLRSLENACS